MIRRKLQVLSPAHVAQFFEKGWCKLENCFTKEAAWDLRMRWVREQGLEPSEPLNWPFEVRHKSLAQSIRAATFSPKAQAAAEDLVGKGRMKEWWWNNFIVNTRLQKKQGWHVDGIFFKHFLDSPEQALLTIQLYSDVEEDGGGTAILEGSYADYARALARYPEGIEPVEAVRLSMKVTPWRKLKTVEAVGKAGTVYFCHPFLIHSSTPNHRGRPRFATNATVFLERPMRFDDPDTASVVEESLIRALGGPFDFRAAAPRRRYEPGEYKKFHRGLPKKQKAGGVGTILGR